ncbi:MAG: hypothetical protein OXE52_11465 [Chloroflexi bacterium]|nr:hypothetical protein [Chloroflexota bacterium]
MSRSHKMIGFLVGWATRFIKRYMPGDWFGFGLKIVRLCPFADKKNSFSDISPLFGQCRFVGQAPGLKRGGSLCFHVEEYSTAGRKGRLNGCGFETGRIHHSRSAAAKKSVALTENNKPSRRMSDAVY